MIKLINGTLIDYLKKLSARNQYYTNTIYLCFYSCSNKKIFRNRCQLKHYNMFFLEPIIIFI